LIDFIEPVIHNLNEKKDLPDRTKNFRQSRNELDTGHWGIHNALTLVNPAPIT
jgi:hypothetical protein